MDSTFLFFLLNGKIDLIFQYCVGLGTGSKEQQIVMLNNILERQLQAFQLQGQRECQWLGLKNIYNTLAKIVENAGLKNVDSYFINPDIGKQM